MIRNPGSVWRPVAAIVVALTVLTLIAVVYTSNAISSDNHKWCTTLNTLNNANNQAHPSGAYGVELARDFRNLRSSLGCR